MTMDMADRSSEKISGKCTRLGRKLLHGPWHPLGENGWPPLAAGNWYPLGENACYPLAADAWSTIYRRVTPATAD